MDSISSMIKLVKIVTVSSHTLLPGFVFLCKFLHKKDIENITREYNLCTLKLKLLWNMFSKKISLIPYTIKYVPIYPTIYDNITEIENLEIPAIP